MANSPPERRPWLRGSRLFLLLLLGFALLTWLTQSGHAGGTTVRYGEFQRILDLPGVGFRDVTVSRNYVRGDVVTRDAVSGLDKPELVAVVPFRTSRQGLEFDEHFVRKLDAAMTNQYQGDDEDAAAKTLGSLVSGAIFLGLMLMTGLLLLRWMSGGVSPLSFGRSRHRLYAQKENKITFADAAGIDEAVEELKEVVDFLKRPGKYQALGGRIPKGVLLVGPPGTGKTLLAKAVAGEADVPFFSLSGSDFVEMFVGVGAARVRDLFREAEQKAPCIIFIDELDALGKSRGGVAVGGHDEREQTLNALLVEMDGFESNKGVIIMAATNRPETLDAALLRPGRFDRTVVVDRPDLPGREAILKVHARNTKLGDGVDLRRVAALTPGSVGADLANLVNEATLLAARKEKESVGMAEFTEAIEREAVGLERKSRIMNPDEKKRIAYHEAGHALVAVSLPLTDPVHKVSIIPRGVGTGGYVLSRPDEDRHLVTRRALENRVKTLLGGTVAEELVYGDISNGATSDLNHVNRITRGMVQEYGMSRLGRVYLRDGEGPSFLPGLGGGHREFSEETAREADLEVRRIIDEATAEVRELLTHKRPQLEMLAARLVEKEVIDGDELKDLLAAADAPE